jgi:hypothetical protein
MTLRRNSENGGRLLKFNQPISQTIIADSTPPEALPHPGYFGVLFKGSHSVLDFLTKCCLPQGYLMPSIFFLSILARRLEGHDYRWSWWLVRYVLSHILHSDRWKYANTIVHVTNSTETFFMILHSVTYPL